jgi:glutathione peroxidase
VVPTSAETIYDIDADTIDGRRTSLEIYRGQVLLIVNVASQCGYTPQYRDLDALHRRYHARGFSVLGFPCNQFGGQEPLTDVEIAKFCENRYAVSFPMFRKIDVNGAHEHPLYTYLKAAKSGLFGWSAIKWNFTKFLVDRGGHVIGRYGPRDLPESCAADIEAALGRAE